VGAERRKQWEPKIPDLRVFDSPAGLLAEPLDGVVVEGRVGGNLKLARLALERGYPVLLEKPAGIDLDDYKRLLDLAGRKRLHVQMFYLFRYMTAVVEMIRQARAGELGDIYEFRARLSKPLASYDRYVEILGEYKGGMFFEEAGHLIDFMIAMLGRPTSISPFLAHHHKGPPADYVDDGLAVYGYPRAWAILEVPSLEVAPNARRIEVYGTKGAFVIPHLGTGHLVNPATQPIEVFHQGDKDWRRVDLPSQTLRIKDLREFAACIAGRKKPDYSVEHDLAVQEVLLRSCGAIRAGLS
jgi:predicted dehydrogenase